jgi:hypothetical protein
MPVNLGPAAKPSLEHACPAVPENHFEVDALLAQFPTPPDTIPPPPTAKDAVSNVIGGVTSTASSMVSRLWGSKQT